MRVEVLHRAAVVDDHGHRATLRPRTAKALVVLALRHPSAVSADELIDAMWAEPPGSSDKGVQNAIVDLRRILGPTCVERSTAGYRLLLDDRHSLDLDELQRHGETDDLASIERALAMLDGELLADLRDAAMAISHIARLEFLRADLEERRIDVLIDAGSLSLAAREAVRCAAAAPSREHRWAQLALALYRSGRQVDALRALAEARRVLRLECGVSPGPELISLEAQVLAHDPRLFPAPGQEPGTDAWLELSLERAQRAADQLEPNWFDEALEAMRLARQGGRVDALRAAGALVGIVDTGLGRTWRDRQRGAAIESSLHQSEGGTDGEDPGERLLQARLLTNQALTSLDADARHLAWQHSKALAALDLLDTIDAPARVNVVAVVEILQGCHSALLGPGQVERRRGCTTRLVELARYFEQPQVIMAAAGTSVVDSAERGDLVEVDQWLGALDGLRNELPLLVWNREVIRSSRLASQGRFQAALVAADAALQDPASGHHPVANLIHMGQRLNVHDALGTGNVVHPALEASLPELDHSLGDPLIVMGALRHGEFRVASDALADAARAGFADVKQDFLHTSNLRLWAEIAIIVDDPGAAAVLYDKMTPLSALFTAARTAGFGIPVQSVLGRLAAVLGRPAAALSHHSSAVMRARKARADHLVAVAQAWLASGVAAAIDAEPADIEIAIDAATEAVAISTHTGAQPTLELGRRALELLKSR